MAVCTCYIMMMLIKLHLHNPSHNHRSSFYFIALIFRNLITHNCLTSIFPASIQTSLKQYLRAA